MPPIDTDGNDSTLHNIDFDLSDWRIENINWPDDVIDAMADAGFTPVDNDMINYYADIVADPAGAASQYYINGLKDFVINGVRQDIVSGYDGASEEECPDESTKNKVTWEEVFY